MPIVPNAELAFIPREKLTKYLLNAGHVRGGPKARFYFAFGFSADAPEVMEAALLKHVRSYEATGRTAPFGIVYRVDGPLSTPSGRSPRVRSIWIVTQEEVRPRLVTAMPTEPL